MKDLYNREIKSLRISITPKCNLNCFYCHKEGHNIDNDKLMTPTEIGEIVKFSLKYGIIKLKISGGEPLLRSDLPDIIRNIKNIENNKIKDISLTTNGILLEKYAQELKDAGLNRVNVSLDTLDAKLYKKITGGNVELVKRGIEKAIKVGLNPIKINFVVLSNTIDGLKDIMEYCRKMGVILQIIEFMPIDEKLKKYHYDINKIEEKISKKSDKTIVRKFMQNRKKYLIDGLEIEFVRPMDNTEFCSHCTRIRLTYDGLLKPCLLRDDNLVDILTPLRNGEDINKYFIKCIDRRELYFKE